MRFARIPICATIAMFSILALTNQGNADDFSTEIYITQSPLEDIVDAIGQVREAAQDKVLASQELADARTAYYHQLDLGILGSPEEEAFGDLLRAKDLYFLSMTVTEGVFASAGRNNAINTLTGIFSGSVDLNQPAEHNPLDIVGGQALADADMDGGITQKSAFSGWVNAVRRALGADQEGQLVFVTDPVTYQAAIDASVEAYDYYRAQRDKAEFERWREQRTPVRTPPLADPQQRVDLYLTATRIKLEGEGVSSAVIDDWAPRLKDILLQGEGTEITPDVIVKYMQAKGFTAEDIEFWKTTYQAFKAQADYSPIWTPLDALCETHVMRDKRLYGQSASCSDANYVISIKAWLNEGLQEKRHKLFLEVGLRDVVDYDVASLAMQDGRFAYEPPLPVFRQYDAAPPAPVVPIVPEANPESGASEHAVSVDPAPAVAAPEAALNPPVEIPPAPAQPDPGKMLAGMKLVAWSAMPGDELDQVDRLVTQGMKVATVIDNDPKAWGYGKAVLTARVYVADQDQSRLTLMWLPDDPHRRVVAIVRRLAMPGPPIVPYDEVNASLTDQFGPGSDSSKIGSGSSEAYWYMGKDDLVSDCAEVQSIGLGNGFVVTSGALPTPPAGEGPSYEPSWFMADTMMTNDFQYPDRMAALSGCEKEIVAQYAADVRHPYLTIGLFDAALAVRIASELNASPSFDLGKLQKGGN